MNELASSCDLVEEAFRTFDTKSLGGMEPSSAYQGLTAVLEDRFALNDPGTLKSRHARFDISGSQPVDYRERVVEIAEGRSILAGIRHFGGDRERPFVDCWQGYSLESWEDLREVAEALHDQFKIFSPLHLRLWLNPRNLLAQSLDAKSSPAISQNLLCVAGRLSVMQPLRPAQNGERVLLVGQEELFEWSWYEALYQDFHSQFPGLKALVPVSSREGESFADRVWPP